MSLRFRSITPADLPALLALNQRFDGKVGSLDDDRLAWLVNAAWWTCTTPEHDAFMIVLPPGVGYGSPNYRWIDGRWRRYAYIDRIAVDDRRQRTGVGAAMYRALFAQCVAAGVPRVTCEVNVRPFNEGSLAFHDRLGFTRCGIRSDGPDGVTVAMLSRKVTTADR